MNDELRPIAGFDGSYSVTSDGRVLSHPRTVDRRGKSMTVPGRWLQSFPDRAGYLVVALSIGGKPKHHLVHRLVAGAWLQNPSPATRKQVNHLSGVTSDNRHTNLEWCTPQENVLHSFRVLGRVHGPGVREHAKRMGTAQRTLTAEQVLNARARKAAGETLTSIAASLNLSMATTHSLIHRRTYRDI